MDARSRERDEVRRRTDLLTLVAETVPLKQAGREWVGCCPFHDDRTPSFSVSREEGVFYCHGCHKGGDVFDFVMLRDGVDFRAALELLAGRAGVTLSTSASPEAAARTAQRRRLVNLLEAAAAFYEGELAAGQGAEARAYLDARGVGPEARATFRLGVAPAAWSRLSEHLLARGAAPEDLVAAGLSLRRRDDRGLVDRFRDRIMFPIRDVSGRVVGFGGRRLKDGEGPKYLNSPEGLVFTKRHFWYDLSVARPAIRREGRVVVVEGYMDVIACHEAGIPGCVASLGTSLTTEQVQGLGADAERVILAYDADQAGRAAALRAIAMMVGRGLDVRVCLVPDGKDPDEFVRQHGGPAFRAVLEGARPWLEFAYDEAAARHDPASAAGIGRIAADVLRLVGRLASPVEAEAARVWLAGRLGVSEASLTGETARVQSRRDNSTANRENRRKHPVNLEPPMAKVDRELIRLAVRAPGLRSQLAELAHGHAFADEADAELFRFLVETGDEGLPEEPRLRARLAEYRLVLPEETDPDDAFYHLERIVLQERLRSLRGMIESAGAQVTPEQIHTTKEYLALEEKWRRKQRTHEGRGV